MVHCSGHIWIPNLIIQKVGSVSDVEDLIRKGDKGRSTFATDMNEHSSRSHLILSLYISTSNLVTHEKIASKLHLIDLAGSERVSRSHAQGDRLREAQNINTSLSALGDVISSLKSHNPHVPYRNCKLTRMLSDSLGGASKTLLVVNLSPALDSAAESRCSCEFASRAKKVELGRATRNTAERDESNKPPPRPASVGASARRLSRPLSASAEAPKFRTASREAARARTASREPPARTPTRTPSRTPSREQLARTPSRDLSRARGASREPFARAPSGGWNTSTAPRGAGDSSARIGRGSSSDEGKLRVRTTSQGRLSGGAPRFR